MTATKPALTYLDYGATTWPKPEGVLRAMREALEGGSPGRGDHPVAARAYALVEGTRRALAEFLGIEEARRASEQPFDEPEDEEPWPMRDPE